MEIQFGVGQILGASGCEAKCRVLGLRPSGHMRTRAAQTALGAPTTNPPVINVHASARALSVSLTSDLSKHGSMGIRPLSCSQPCRAPIGCPEKTRLCTSILWRYHEFYHVRLTRHSRGGDLTPAGWRPNTHSRTARQAEVTVQNLSL